MFKMAVMIIKILYSLFLPTSILVLLLVFIAYRLRTCQKSVSWIVGFVTLTFYLLSIPATTDILVRSLENRYSLLEKIEGDVIIMLCGGATSKTPDLNGLGNLTGASANRLLSTARLQRITNLPIIVSGGKTLKSSDNEAMVAKRQLVELGIPANMIITEFKSRNTIENVQFVIDILDEKQFKRPILVTSALHMTRAVKLFSKQNVTVLPFPTDYLVNAQMDITFLSFIPGGTSLNNLELCLKEYIGMLDPRQGKVV